MADEDVKAELERLRQENERLKARQTRGVSLKVSGVGFEMPAWRNWIWIDAGSVSEGFVTQSVL